MTTYFFPLYPKTQGVLHRAAPDFAKIGQKNISLRESDRVKILRYGYVLTCCQDKLARKTSMG